MAVSLRVPDDVKKRIAKLAQRRKTTSHALMLEAISEKLAAEEVRSAFHAEANRRLRRMKKQGLGIPANEVFEYLQRRGEDKPVPRPKARRLA